MAERPQPTEMRFRPHSGEVVARNAHELHAAGITIPTSVVESTWGKEQAEVYQNLLSQKHSQQSNEIFSAPETPKVSTIHGVQNPDKMLHYIDPYTFDKIS